MDDALLVGVLHRLADRHEQLQPLLGRQPGLVAELGQRQAVDQFHDEERLARRRQAAVEHAGDVGVIHHGQRLPLLLEARQHGLGVHAGLDELERHLAFDGLGLLGDPDLAHAAFADLLLQRVAAGDDACRARPAGGSRWSAAARAGSGVDSPVAQRSDRRSDRRCRVRGGRSSKLPDASWAASSASTAARSCGWPAQAAPERRRARRVVGPTLRGTGFLRSWRSPGKHGGVPLLMRRNGVRGTKNFQNFFGRLARWPKGRGLFRSLATPKDVIYRRRQPPVETQAGSRAAKALNYRGQ